MEKRREGMMLYNSDVPFLLTSPGSRRVGNGVTKVGEGVKGWGYHGANYKERHCGSRPLNQASIGIVIRAYI